MHRKIGDIGEIPPASPGQNIRGFRLVKEFLLEFGYLNAISSPIDDALDSDSVEALRRYQKFFGLVQTGDFTEETRAVMSSPRCSRSDARSVASHAAGGKCVVPVRPWNSGFGAITYAIDSPPGALFKDVVVAEINKAFRFWKLQAGIALPVEFERKEVISDAFLVIDWIVEEDYQPAGLGGDRISFCDFPPEQGHVPTPGALHMVFDNLKPWALDTVVGKFHIASVVMHEIGHLIGLDHCGHGSIMNPNVKPGPPARLQLQAQDIDAVKTLYGT
jgi:hypothetical protein